VKRTSLNDSSGGVQRLSVRADVDVARTVEDEVGPAEGSYTGMCGAILRSTSHLSSRIRAQSSRRAEFGGVGMSFNIYRGALGSLAMVAPMRRASSQVSTSAYRSLWARSIAPPK